MSTTSHPVIAGNVYQDFADAVGNTALIRLRGPSEATGCEIYGKAEFQNPGGSVKDRAALQIVLEAEEQGILTPGEPGIIVEGTAGNTGIGLTHMGNSRGYQTVIVIGANQSQEKKDALVNAGAQLVEVPAVPYKNPNNYVHVAERLATKLSEKHGGKGVLYANQWDNLANRRAHIMRTGPEIWAQTGGKLDAFSCAMGTGGTLTGVAEYLRQQTSEVKIALTDPCGAALVRYYNEGELRGEGDSISEGIGQGRVTGVMEGFSPDIALEVTDQVALPVIYDLMEKEGLNLGTSSAVNVAGAMEVARRLGPGHRIVTVLCDLGTRYASKMYNVNFLRSKGLPVPRWLDDTNSERAEWQAELREVVQDALLQE